MSLVDNYIIINITLSMTKIVSIADRVVSAVIFIRIYEYTCVASAFIVNTSITYSRDLNSSASLTCIQPVITKSAL